MSDDTEMKNIEYLDVDEPIYCENEKGTTGSDVIMQEVQMIEEDEGDLTGELMESVDGHTIIVHDGKQYVIPIELQRPGQTIVLDENEGEFVIQDAEEEQQEQIEILPEDEDDDCYMIYKQEHNPDSIGRQYAVLKDGRLHIEENVVEDEIDEKLHVFENSLNLEGPNDETSVDIVNTGGVHGTNLLTGQTISLSSFFEKMRERNTDTPVQKKRANTAQTPVNNYVQVQPVNKTVVVGRTPEGKRVIGKILQIKKKVTSCTEFESIPPVLPVPLPRQKTPEILSPEPPHNVVVKTRYVSKAFLDQNIVRTLSGLMEMESVEKHLTDRNLIIRHVLKHSRDGKVLPEREVTYYYGHMQRVSTNDSEGNWRWTFISTQLNQEESASHSTDSIGCIDLNQDQNEQQLNVNINESTGEVTFGNESRLPNPRDDKPTITLILSVTQDEYGKKRTKVMIPQLSDSTKKVCDGCGRQFHTEFQLQRHVCPLVSSHTCHFCMKQFNSSIALRRHISTHDQSHRKTTARKYRCNGCGKQFNRHSNMVRHAFVHQVGGTSQLSTTVTSVVDNTPSTTNNASSTSAASGKVPYTCETCGCQYNFVSSLTRHIVNNHMSINNCNDVQTDE